jgi:hypothetical protein
MAQRPQAEAEPAAPGSHNLGIGAKRTPSWAGPKGAVLTHKPGMHALAADARYGLALHDQLAFTAS